MMTVMPARPASRIRKIVFRPNSTVATIRAQLLPLLFAQAIHAHKITAMIPPTARMMTAVLATVWICDVVRTALPSLRLVTLALIAALVAADLILLLKASVAMTPTSARAPPAHLRRTAFVSAGGFGGRTARPAAPLFPLPVGWRGGG